jgi:translation elongation factor EF-1beta
MKREEIVRIVKRNLKEGERWHRKVNVREIVFGILTAAIPYEIGELFLPQILSKILG